MRKSKISNELIRKLTHLIKAGLFIETAAQIAGIHKDTFYDWLKRGAREDEKPIFRRFHDEIFKALAEAEARDVLRIDKAIEEGAWQAAAWRLERKFPDRWGKKDKLYLEHFSSQAVQSLSDTELIERAKNLSAEIIKKLNP